MSDGVAEAILNFVRSAPGAEERIDPDTDLLLMGVLDSLLIMDLVCFLESRFQVRMLPSDITPANLQTVRCLVSYVRETASDRSRAA